MRLLSHYVKYVVQGFVHTSKRHVSSFFMANIASDKIIAESLSPFAKVNSMFQTF